MIVRNKLNNLFTTIHNKKPNLLLFEYMDKDLLDIYYTSMYGSRKLSDLGNKDIDIIVDLIINIYSSKWDKTIETYFSTFINIGKSGYMLNEIVEDVGENTLTRNMLNEVSAYNDDDFSNHNQDSEQQSGNNLNNKIKETEYIKYLNVKDISKIMEYLKNEYIHVIIIEDINKLLTLNIF